MWMCLGIWNVITIRMHLRRGYLVERVNDCMTASLLHNGLQYLARRLRQRKMT